MPDNQLTTARMVAADSPETAIARRDQHILELETRVQELTCILQNTNRSICSQLAAWMTANTWH